MNGGGEKILAKSSENFTTEFRVEYEKAGQIPYQLFVRVVSS
jgi:hypothetical protein